jgi:hypothetical protein
VRATRISGWLGWRAQRGEPTMTLPRLGDVLRDAGGPDLLEILGERLSPPELETISIESTASAPAG